MRTVTCGEKPAAAGSLRSIVAQPHMSEAQIGSVLEIEATTRSGRRIGDHAATDDVVGLHGKCASVEEPTPAIVCLVGTDDSIVEQADGA